MTDAWVQRGIEDFNRGSFDNGGDNLYVNARGRMETIHRTDANGDGYVDLVFPNSHGYIERGPTWIYTQANGTGTNWPRQQLANDSGCCSVVCDVDGDGHQDLIVINGENGVTSELDSYVYWGGPGGLTGERAELPTVGAYSMAAVDLSGNGLMDLIIPSAWMDHHNPGESRLIQVFEQTRPRRFEEVGERYGLKGMAALSVACEDLTGDGYPDLVVANYREGFEYDIDSYLYPGIPGGFERAPIRLPTHCALDATVGDLNGDGRKEILFSGGDRVYVYWNRDGRFDPGDVEVLEAEGNSTMFSKGSIRTEVADVDGDGRNELLIAMRRGVEIRDGEDLQTVRQLLEFEHSGWVEAHDLNGSGRLDLVVSCYQNGGTYECDSAVLWNVEGGLSGKDITRLPTAGAVGATAGDLDGDGVLEVVYNNTMGGPSQWDPDFPLYIYLGGESHEYVPSRRIELPTGGGTNTYVMADLSLDGYVDLVFVSPEGLRIFHGGPDGLRADRYTVLPSRGHFFHSILAGDFDRDGWLDLIGCAYTYDDKPETMANSSVVFYGSEEGFSSERSQVLPTFGGGTGQLVDIDGDGYADFVSFNRNGFLQAYLGGPEGFSEERLWKLPLHGSGAGGMAGLTPVDLNGDGYLDLIGVVMGHYMREESGFYILWGGPDGYSVERTEFYDTAASSIMISAADLDNDGHLDLLVPAYSTKFTRELPARIYYGSVDGVDFDNPVAIPCDSSCAFLPVDITGNGYVDVLAVCHRNDLGHQVDSMLFWNGPEGLDFEEPTRLPALGPHLASSRDFGNAYTREPLERYVSPACELGRRRPVQMSWTAEVPESCRLGFELRAAETEEGLAEEAWTGPGGEESWYEDPGVTVSGIDAGARWLQYRVTFFHANGCRSPQLAEVRFELAS